MVFLTVHDVGATYQVSLINAHWQSSIMIISSLNLSELGDLLER